MVVVMIGNYKINMILKNHIAYRFLLDDELALEMLEATHPLEFKKMLSTPKEDVEISSKVANFYNFITPKDQTAYYITNTVLDKLDLLKIKKIHTDGVGEHYDWTFFKNIKNQKVTLIFPDNSLLRCQFVDDVIQFCKINFEYKKGSNQGNMDWVMFYVNRITGEQCDHFNHIDVKTIEKFVYCLLAFFYLSDNELIIVSPGHKYGTRKEGKLINTFKDIPITIVNSNWNITSVRTEEFGVRGHFAIRWSGEGRTIPKMVFIEPFIKKGYVRRAKNVEHI